MLQKLHYSILQDFLLVIYIKYISCANIFVFLVSFKKICTVSVPICCRNEFRCLFHFIHSIFYTTSTHSSVLTRFLQLFPFEDSFVLVFIIFGLYFRPNFSEFMHKFQIFRPFFGKNVKFFGNSWQIYAKDSLIYYNYFCFKAT